MGKLNRNHFSAVITVLGAVIFLFAGSGYALDISITPNQATRASGLGPPNILRVQIHANSATALISMGVKVSFDPTVLQVTNASKNVNFADGFVMDGDGNESTTDDQYTTPLVEINNTEGHVILMGGRLMGPGASTAGLTGKVLLGWIDFSTVGNGSTYLNVSLAKEHPNHPVDTFDNFVTLTGAVEDPAGLPANPSWMYVGADACEANLNGDDRVNIADVNILRSEFGRIDCNNSGQLCLADLNGDGRVNVSDVTILNSDFGRINCPQTP